MIQLYRLLGYRNVMSFSKRMSQSGLGNNVVLNVLTSDKPEFLYYGDIKSRYYALVSSAERLKGHLPLYLSRNLGTVMWGILLREILPSPKNTAIDVRKRLEKLEEEISLSGLTIIERYVPHFLEDNSFTS